MRVGRAMISKRDNSCSSTDMAAAAPKYRRPPTDVQVSSSLLSLGVEVQLQLFTADR